MQNGRRTWSGPPPAGMPVYPGGPDLGWVAYPMGLAIGQAKMPLGLQSGAVAKVTKGGPRLSRTGTGVYLATFYAPTAQLSTRTLSVVSDCYGAASNTVLLSNETIALNAGSGFYIDSSARLRAYMRTGGGWGDVVLSTSSMVEGDIVGMTYDGATFRGYFNGVLVASQSISGAIVHGADTGRIGARGDGTGPTNNPSCGFLYIYNRPLSPIEMWRISQAPYGEFCEPGAESTPSSAAALIAGTQAGEGAQSGNIVTAIQPAGIQIGLGSQSGALSTAITLAGTVSGVGTQAGDILTRIELSGQQLGAGLQALSLATGISVAGLIAGEGAASGGIVTTINIGGQQLADSLIQGGVATAISIAGQQYGAGAQSGGLGGGPVLIGGSQAGEGSQSLVLSTSITLTGQQIATALLQGSLTTEVRIGAVQNGLGTILGGLNTAISLAGTVSGTGAQVGTLGSVLMIIWHSPFMKVHRRPSRFQIAGQVGFQIRHN